MSQMSGKINAFFYKNRNKGIPNLMLYIAIGNVVVYVLSMLNRENLLFLELLRFDFAKIMQLQLWRLLTYPLTYLTQTAQGSMMGILWGAIGLFFYFYCGKVIEANWGVLRFNCYYLAGILLTDFAGILIGLISGIGFSVTSAYINTSLFLAVATLQPEAGVRLYFVIPLKMKWLAWFELGLTVYEIVILMLSYGFLRFVWILPIFAILNYFLFFGKDFVNVLPEFMKRPKNRAQRQAAQNYRSQVQSYRSAPQSYRPAAPTRSPVRETRPYRFRCTVCGRTDVSNPTLEFRYCSKCAGYRCYCSDHIGNHAHITE